MANTFKNFRGVMVTGGVTAYTCPALTTAIILHCQVANIDGVNSADATVHWTDSSNSAAVTQLAKIIPVAGATAMSVLTGKLVLEAGDTIVATASADGDLILSGSVLEMA